MAGLWLGRRVAPLVLALGIVSFGLAPAAQAQQSNDLTAIKTQIFQLNNAGRFADALAVGEQALAASVRRFGAENPAAADLHLLIAIQLQSMGQVAKAEPHYRTGLKIKERTGPNDPDLGMFVGGLGLLLYAQGRYDEAEPYLRRQVQIFEKARPGDDSQVAAALYLLGSIYSALSRMDEAVSLLSRSVAMFDRLYPDGHGQTAIALHNLAVAYQLKRDYLKAAELTQREIQMLEKFMPPGNPSFPRANNNLGFLYQQAGQLDLSATYYQKALDQLRVIFPEGHPDVAAALINFATLLDAQGRSAEAVQRYNEALAIHRKWLPADHPQLAYGFREIAFHWFLQQNWREAVNALRNANAISVARSNRRSAFTQPASGEVENSAVAFKNFVKAAYRLDAKSPAIQSEAFQIAQHAANSPAAQTLAQMAARNAKGDQRLANLARERQDLIADWQAHDQALVAALSKPVQERNETELAALRTQIAAIDGRITAINGTLATDFPDYAALSNPQPLAIKDVQTLLAPNEALVMFLDTPVTGPTPEEAFLWAITKTSARWVRLGIGGTALTREVTALRCGLDYEGAWADPARCRGLLEADYTEQDSRAGKPLPFDAQRAYALYKSLFGEVEDIIKGKELLVVPAGALTQLPMHVLVTSEPAPTSGNDSDYRKVQWLARSHAVTVLPAVSSLKALRQNAKSTAAKKPFLGVGNPLLTGPGPGYERLRRAAVRNQSCSTIASAATVVAQSRSGATRSGAGLKPVASQAGIADVAAIKLASPLPETAEELCAVARAIGADDSDVLLGSRASETEIKKLSEPGALRNYRILHFATHGALAGEIAGSSEPGLVLTPPDVGTQADDGYLSASEVADLKLDADWVILSACNTAAGGAEGAEALSGLARAFFYAGARALLVSHWYVDSKSTVALVKGAFSEIKTDPRVGRAEAVRRSIVNLIDNGKPAEAYPANWAPFVVVGEGAAVR